METMGTKAHSGLIRFLPATAAAIMATAFVMVSFAVFAGEIEHQIARGGRLYDRWYKITDGDLPKATHPSYPKSGKKSKKTTWRCKECHGWDYMGKDGAYAKGSHFTGIKGVRAAAGTDTGKIIAVLKSKSHGFTDKYFTPEDFRDVALFVSKGQVDMDKYIDRKTKTAKGDKSKGRGYYETLCAGCHDLDGKKPKDMAKSIGAAASDDPWQTLHKIRNGQPSEKMVALRALPIDIAIDIFAHIATLPK